MPERGYIPHTYWTVSRDAAEPTDGGVIEESHLNVKVNGQPVASIMCSPVDEEALALGFLYNEGFLNTREDIEAVHTDLDAEAVNVILYQKIAHVRRQLVRTSGCGGGVTFNTQMALRGGVRTDFITTPEVIFARMRDLRSAARLYIKVRGVHTALLGDTENALCSAEDVGRHNTVDKIAGKALCQQIDASNAILVTSGRISSEMCAKANRMNLPIVASRTAPTSTAVDLAEKWGICVVGYVRNESLRVYTHPHRLGLG